MCTRCFANGVESYTLIPMADNLNHSSVEVNLEMINTHLHLNSTTNLDYFRIAKVVNDYNIVFQNWLKEEELEDHKLEVAGRFDRSAFANNLEHMNHCKVLDLMRTSPCQIWEVPYFLDEFQEYNDTSSDDEEIKDQGQFVMVLGEKVREGKIREGHGLEFFI